MAENVRDASESTQPAGLRRFLSVGGCLPLAVLVALVLLAFVNAVTYVRPPSWIDDVAEWRLSGRLLVSFWVVAGLQLIATWILGLSGAIAGAQAHNETGDLGRRLRRAQWRLVAAALGVLALRLLLLIVVLTAVGLVAGHVFNPTIDGWLASRLLQLSRRYAWLGLASAAVIGLHLLIGPFLRTRYSVALGLWAAARARNDEERAWAAASARLMAGFAGVFGLLWGGATIVLVWASLTDPILDWHGLPTPYFLPSAPDPLSTILGVMLVTALISGCITAGQIVLPPLFRALAMRRLRAADAGAESDV